MEACASLGKQSVPEMHLKPHFTFLILESPRDHVLVFLFCGYITELTSTSLVTVHTINMGQAPNLSSLQMLLFLKPNPSGILTELFLI